MFLHSKHRNFCLASQLSLSLLLLLICSSRLVLCNEQISFSNSSPDNSIVGQGASTLVGKDDSGGGEGVGGDGNGGGIGNGNDRVGEESRPKMSNEVESAFLQEVSRICIDWKRS